LCLGYIWLVHVGAQEVEFWEVKYLAIFHV
jgi:hypothetical protein